MNFISIIKSEYPHLSDEAADKIVQVLGKKHQARIVENREILTILDEIVRDDINNYSKYTHSATLECKLILITTLVEVIETIEHIQKECGTPKTPHICKQLLSIMGSVLSQASLDGNDHQLCGAALWKWAKSLPS